MKFDITKETILREISEIEIYNKYTQSQVKLGSCILSPFRDEKNESFSIFIGNLDGSILWKDFATGDHGDCFHLVEKLYNCNYDKALQIIIKDFNLDIKSNSLSFTTKIVKAILPIKKEIEIITDVFNPTEVKNTYWIKYNLSLEEIYKWGIVACKSVYINKIGLHYSEEEPVFVIKINDHYKIYRPCSIRFKWLGNVTKDDIFIMNNFINHENLLITKSFKDCLCLYKEFKDTFDIVSFQSESMIPSKNILDKLFAGRTCIYILYDNDKAGISGSKALETYIIQNYPNIVVINISNNNFDRKDFSDLLETHGKYAYKILEELLKDNGIYL